jgi:hypothetical protein
MRELATFKLSEKTIDTILNIAVVLSLLLLGYFYINRPQATHAENPASSSYAHITLQKISSPEVKAFEEAPLVEEPTELSYTNTVPANSVSQKSLESGKKVVQASQTSQALKPVIHIIESVKLL